MSAARCDAPAAATADAASTAPEACPANKSWQVQVQTDILLYI